MNRDEAINVIATIMDCWTAAQEWTDRQAEMWIKDLEPLEYQRAMSAVHACRDEHHFIPSWAQYREAYRTVTWQQLDPERNPPATMMIEARLLPKSENARRVRLLKAHLRQQRRPDDHDHTKGLRNCPVCGQHDVNAQGLHKPEHCARCKELSRVVFDAIAGEP